MEVGMPFKIPAAFAVLSNAIFNNVVSIFEGQKPLAEHCLITN
ncbi:MAG: hypothetical protein AVDCRST_MAG96-3822 [uncultured Segetibacter sp.]|uniref:Uncharacterized protein n=1 Tax=uncultured Segetibacter sp. TaxID=481133 RepID=A0A6J4TY39_9BACT|nr:MAG: hypothetical protein AVDCRST_MAG96-3822 [uncultured Segetibacter sp.]